MGGRLYFRICFTQIYKVQTSIGIHFIEVRRSLVPYYAYDAFEQCRGNDPAKNQILQCVEKYEQLSAEERETCAGLICVGFPDNSCTVMSRGEFANCNERRSFAFRFGEITTL